MIADRFRYPGTTIATLERLIKEHGFQAVIDALFILCDEQANKEGPEQKDWTTISNAVELLPLTEVTYH